MILWVIREDLISKYSNIQLQINAGLLKKAQGDVAFISNKGVTVPGYINLDDSSQPTEQVLADAKVTKGYNTCYMVCEEGSSDWQAAVSAGYKCIPAKYFAIIET